MSGRIVYTPPPSSECERLNRCLDIPPAGRYPDGTVWQCDSCGKRWEKWSGAQYNEPFDAWRRERSLQNRSTND